MSIEAARTSHITYRRGALPDVPRMIELMAAASLPPLFVEEYIEGFIAAECDGEIWACGGLEMYGDCGVIRSVVVDEPGRGLGVGRRIAEMLIADAQGAGASDLYLFTGDAVEFWKRLGFAEVTFDEWKAAPRMCWQYQFLSQNRDIVGAGIHTMWRTA